MICQKGGRNGPTLAHTDFPAPRGPSTTIISKGEALDMRKLAIVLCAFWAVMAASTVALAADAAVTVAALETVSSIALAAGLGIAFGVFGPALGQGLAVFATSTGIARNPEAAGTLRVNMIIGLALIESLAIYALVVALLLIYAFPFSGAVSALLG